VTTLVVCLTHCRGSDTRTRVPCGPYITRSAGDEHPTITNVSHFAMVIRLQRLWRHKVRVRSRAAHSSDGHGMIRCVIACLLSAHRLSSCCGLKAPCPIPMWSSFLASPNADSRSKRSVVLACRVHSPIVPTVIQQFCCAGRSYPATV
jgi:hypothetical protein